MAADFDILSRDQLAHIGAVLAGIERGEPWAIREGRRMARSMQAVGDWGASADEGARAHPISLKESP